jgi:hypothetical protein
MRTKQELEQRLADLKARKTAPATTATSQPEPTVTVSDDDAAVAEHAKQLMAMFRRKDGAEPAPTAPTQTVSVSEAEFQTLKNLKAAQDAAAAAEKRAEGLEKSLQHVTEHLATFTMMQQRTLAENAGKLSTPWQVEYQTSQLQIIKTVTEVAIKLFVAYQQISDAALEGFGASAEDVTKWRTWAAAYKTKDASYWLERLADRQGGKSAPMLPGQERLFVELLTNDGVNVKKRLEEINAERLRRFDQEHPLQDDARGRALAQHTPIVNRRNRNEWDV